jgi:hypothetical protein
METDVVSSEEEGDKYISINPITQNFSVETHGTKTRYKNFKDMPSSVKNDFIEDKNDLRWRLRAGIAIGALTGIFLEGYCLLDDLKKNVDFASYVTWAAAGAAMCTAIYYLHKRAYDLIEQIPKGKRKALRAAEEAEAPHAEENGNYESTGYLALKPNNTPSENKEEELKVPEYDGSEIEVVSDVKTYISRRRVKQKAD